MFRGYRLGQGFSQVGRSFLTSVIYCAHDREKGTVHERDPAPTFPGRLPGGFR